MFCETNGILSTTKDLGSRGGVTMINGIRPAGLAPLTRAEDVSDGVDTPDVAVRPQSSFQPFRAPPVALTAVQSAAARLNPDERQKFAALQQAMPQDAASQASLNKLLVSGALTERDSAGGTMLDNLSKLTDPNVQLQGGADPHQLLSDLVNESADPSKIQQGTDNEFCGAAAAAQSLASQNPAEYSRIVTGLATDGQVDIAATHSRGKGNGMMLSLPANFDAGDPTRSLTQQYLAQPLTQLAAGSDEHIDGRGNGHINNQMVVGRRDDGSQVTVGPSVQPGTYANQVADMQSDLTGRDYDAASLPEPGDARRGPAVNAAKDLLHTQVTANTQPAVELDHHWFNVSKMDDKNVTLVDHFGKKTTMPVDDFFNKAVALTYDKGVTPQVPPELCYDGHGGPGGGWNPSAGQNRPGT
jgi:hypothetical protein